MDLVKVNSMAEPDNDSPFQVAKDAEPFNMITQLNLSTTSLSQTPLPSMIEQNKKQGISQAAEMYNKKFTDMRSQALSKIELQKTEIERFSKAISQLSKKIE